MIVCIAEKPSVARELARILGANSREDGYLQGNGYAVTWTFGHLCTLKDPEDYHPWWKSWELRDLPLIPKRFGIKPIPNDKSYLRQLNIIKGLVEKADRVINCGDAGQEGELIQRWVLQYVGCKAPVERLWVSSLTDEAIREGFRHLRPQTELESLYHAGLARAIGDWLLGINATRLYTIRYRDYSAPKQPLSVGRVQTPTLALLVDRQHEIERFESKTTFEICTLYRGVSFRQTKDSYETEEQAKEKLKELEGKPFEVTAIVVKQGKKFPPKLFDLTSLQVEANKRLKMTAEETLRTIQSLYEKKLTTYPRVDTNYLSEDLWPKIPSILKAIQRCQAFAQSIPPLLEKGKLKKTKRVFDNKKITDHHAIIPTGVLPKDPLTKTEQNIYELIAFRFIAVFYPEAKISTTMVEGIVDDFPFKATGKQILSEGWRSVYKNTEDDKEDEDTKSGDPKEQLMPTFVKGEQGKQIPEVKKRISQPPKYYTEATLLLTMETAGKLVDDDTLRDMLKQNGIGRPSTRAAIIETLFRRGYIEKVGNSLRATKRGCTLISLIREPMLKSVELTGDWEYKLRAIERGEYQPVRFLDELKEQIRRIVAEELQKN